jgi:uncharacterized protein YbaA (DUF1428 family)
MARYVDGFVLPLPKKNVEAYRKLARKAAKIWIEHGALEYRECLGEDLAHEGMRRFPELADVRRGETVVFAWILYRSRKHRDKVNAAIVADPRIAKMCAEGGMPFDFARMAYGGFEVLVEAKA